MTQYDEYELAELAEARELGVADIENDEDLIRFTLECNQMSDRFPSCILKASEESGMTYKDYPFPINGTVIEEDNWVKEEECSIYEYVDAFWNADEMIAYLAEDDKAGIVARGWELIGHFIMEFKESKEMEERLCAMQNRVNC